MVADEMKSYIFAEGLRALGVMSCIESKFYPN